MSTPAASKPHTRRGPFGLPLLPAHYATVVMPFFLSIIMTGVISLVSTLRSVGLAAGILSLWLGSWALSWVIAFPTLLVVLPLVRKATYGVVQMPHEGSADHSG
ncbi:DUF2798 domain-containing protein [Rhodoferax sp. GW822-FHT02A01]|uniref:DUF2798 domain-containing protein n=1 Tax=Rhodoferax sp. GW822-FHT02A01 TaxID=3141537 RepID=UPI00315D300E